MRKALVTGAAGFIGSALSSRLLAEGWEVVGIDNLNGYYPVKLKKARVAKVAAEHTAFRFETADIRDRDVMMRLFEKEKPHAVVNLAAQAGVRHSIENPYTYADNNLDGFLVMLECARQVPVERFIYASSSSVYGSNSKVPFSEEDPADHPVSLYAATKKSGEMMARAYSALYDIPAVGLRFFTVYGPWGRPDMAPMLFADAIAKGRPIKVFNSGDMMRDFTYIDDITEGVARVLEGGEKRYDIYNIGHGSPVSLLDFISLMEEAFGKKVEKEYLPMQNGDVKITYADTTRLREDYGYLPRTELKEGIKQFAEWYLSNENPLK